MHLAALAQAQAVPTPVAQAVGESGAVAPQQLDLHPASKPTPYTVWRGCHLIYLTHFSSLSLTRKPQNTFSLSTRMM